MSDAWKETIEVVLVFLFAVFCVGSCTFLTYHGK